MPIGPNPMLPTGKGASARAGYADRPISVFKEKRPAAMVVSHERSGTIS